MAKKATKTAKPKAAAKPKASHKPKEASLEQKNQLRLSSFHSEKSGQRSKSFNIVPSSAFQKANECCTVHGTINFVYYANGYAKKADAEKAVKELNEQYFN